MSRYIDADMLIDDLKSMCEQERLEYMGVYDCIKSQPSKNVVEVVRCKDCKFCEDLGMSGMYCKHPDNRNPIGCNPDEYCDCGEKG